VTLYELSLSVAIMIAAVTICGIIGKLLWSIIDLRVSSKYKDYMTIPQMRELMIEVLKTQNVVTMESLLAFCTKAQGTCPKGNEVTTITSSFAAFAGTMKEVVAEQKKLRQEILPKDYPSMHLFEQTVERIERTIAESTGRIEGMVAKIEVRLNEIQARRVTDV
jgi:hypothetical protein